MYIVFVFNIPRWLQGLRDLCIFFQLKKKALSKYVAPIVSYDRECIQKL
jgi:hypothetical protein